MSADADDSRVTSSLASRDPFEDAGSDDSFGSEEEVEENDNMAPDLSLAALTAGAGGVAAASAAGAEAADEEALSDAEIGAEAEADADGEDVDGIVDPLEGLRNEHTERFDREEEVAETADEPSGVSFSGDDFSDSEGENAAGWSSNDAPGDASPEPLDLSDVAPEEAPEGAQDQLELGEAEQLGDDTNVAPFAGGRRRSLVAESGEESISSSEAAPSEAGAAAAAPAGEVPAADPGPAPAPAAAAAGGIQGSTLFERMARLSRGNEEETKKSSDADDDDNDGESGGGLSIPRFLGRQSNQ